MSQILDEPYCLEQDGCYVDRNGIQHYLFPREIENIEDPVELALNEFFWHHNPEYQGQYQEGIGEVEQDWDAITELVSEALTSDKACHLFPRQNFVEYVGEDWDAIAYLEFKWYTLQSLTDGRS